MLGRGASFRPPPKTNLPPLASTWCRTFIAAPSLIDASAPTKLKHSGRGTQGYYPRSSKRGVTLVLCRKWPGSSHLDGEPPPPTTLQWHHRAAGPRRQGKGSGPTGCDRTNHAKRTLPRGEIFFYPAFCSAVAPKKGKSAVAVLNENKRENYEY